MKKHLSLYILGVLLFSLIGLGIYLIKGTDLISSQASPPAAILSLASANTTYTINSTFDIDINLDTAGLYVDGVDIVSLHFPTQYLEFQSGTAGDFIIYPSTITANNGVIMFTGRVPEGNAGFTGLKKVATLKFKALKTTAAAAVTLDFAPGNTVDCNVAEHGTGLDVLLRVNNISFNLIPPSITLNSQMQLQSRSNHGTSGASLEVYRTNHLSTDLPLRTLSLVFASNGTASVIDNQMVDVAYDFRLRVPYFLSKTLRNVSVASSPVSLNFGTLLGGNLYDIGGDDVINSMDFAILNSRWLTTDSVADITADGFVNSLDFAILNSNWLKSGQ